MLRNRRLFGSKMIGIDLRNKLRLNKERVVVRARSLGKLGRRTG